MVDVGCEEDGVVLAVVVVVATVEDWGVDVADEVVTVVLAVVVNSEVNSGDDGVVIAILAKVVVAAEVVTVVL